MRRSSKWKDGRCHILEGCTEDYPCRLEGEYCITILIAPDVPYSVAFESPTGFPFSGGTSVRRINGLNHLTICFKAAVPWPEFACGDLDVTVARVTIEGVTSSIKLVCSQ